MNEINVYVSGCTLPYFEDMVFGGYVIADEQHNIMYARRSVLAQQKYLKLGTAGGAVSAAMGGIGLAINLPMLHDVKTVNIYSDLDIETAMFKFHNVKDKVKLKGKLLVNKQINFIKVVDSEELVDVARAVAQNVPLKELESVLLPPSKV